MNFAYPRLKVLKSAYQEFTSLGDRFFRYPKCMIEDVLVKRILFSIDFMVLDIIYRYFWTVLSQKQFIIFLRN